MSRMDKAKEGSQFFMGEMVDEEFMEEVDLTDREVKLFNVLYNNIGGILGLRNAYPVDSSLVCQIQIVGMETDGSELECGWKYGQEELDCVEYQRGTFRYDREKEEIHIEGRVFPLKQFTKE